MPTVLPPRAAQGRPVDAELPGRGRARDAMDRALTGRLRSDAARPPVGSQYEGASSRRRMGFQGNDQPCRLEQVHWRAGAAGIGVELATAKHRAQTPLDAPVPVQDEFAARMARGPGAVNQHDVVVPCFPGGLDELLAISRADETA
jgi:hypothetical protein